MKKIIILALVLAMSATAMVGCNKAGTSSSTGTTSSAVESKEVKDIKVDDVYEAIKKAYGENFQATMEIPTELLDSEFVVDKSLYTEVKAYMPQIGMHPDRILIYKAAEGKTDDLVKALEAIKKDKIENFMSYPMNLAKTQATEVVSANGVVAFLLCGDIDDNMDATEEQALEFAKKETKKAVDAFNEATK